MTHEMLQEQQTAEKLKGLTEEEAINRRERGQGNDAKIQTSRSYGDILRQNFLTFINVVLFSIGVVMIILGLWQDAIVSVGVVLMNAIVGVIQEFRAKHKLDQIALLTRPKATIIREGRERSVDPSEIVLGDIILARPGDQIVVDGVVVGDSRMDVDESLLTGESDLVPKRADDEVLSGSFCVTGSAAYEATRVGTQSHINKLTANAREFRVVRTPLQQNINFVVRILLLLATMIGLLFFASFAVRRVTTVQTVQTAAVIAGLVPAGLILMTATAYAMGALRMSGKGALIQQMNAVESMSHVNMLCMDKTGTLTANRIFLESVYPLETTEYNFKQLLGDYARNVSAGNRTIEALAEAYSGQSRQAVDEVPFSSARQWSALAFDDLDLSGVYVLGAPETLRRYLPDGVDIGQEQIDKWADRGLRVLLMVYSPDAAYLHDSGDQPRLPDELRPLGLISFGDELRPKVKQTLDGFREAGIRLKIISGDNPHTVAALSRQAGLTDSRVISGPELSNMDDAQLAQIVEDTTIFGRITPDQKEMLIQRLREQGSYVAMIGDGVNDVLSLKKAHIGIAMQSGSAATRGVADIVLLDDSFGALPNAFVEGQRILNGMEDVIRLFLTRAFYAALLIVGTAVVTEAQLFPFIPKHASLITILTVGFPAFALAAWARPGAPRRNLMRSVMHFVFPATLTIAATSLSVYSYYLLNWYLPAVEGSANEFQAIAISRTALTTVLILMGLFLIPYVEPPTKFWVGGDQYSGDKRPTVLAILLLLLFVATKMYDPLRAFFELEILRTIDYLFLITVALVWSLFVRFIWRHNLFERFLGLGADALTRRR